MINPQWLELPMSRTNFHGPKDVRAIEVRLYVSECDVFVCVRLCVANIEAIHVRRIQFQGALLCIRFVWKHKSSITWLIDIYLEFQVHF